MEAGADLLVEEALVHQRRLLLPDPTLSHPHTLRARGRSALSAADAPPRAPRGAASRPRQLSPRPLTQTHSHSTHTAPGRGA
eukprot:3521949-Rhodomonas_salina.1